MKFLPFIPKSGRVLIVAVFVLIFLADIFVLKNGVAIFAGLPCLVVIYLINRDHCSSAEGSVPGDKESGGR